MYNSDKQRAPRNRTMVLSDAEKIFFAGKLLRLPFPKRVDELSNQIICGDTFTVCNELPKRLVDLLILDPPYNLTKKFGNETFREMSLADYEKWFESWFVKMLPALKPTTTIYVCGDWKSSAAIHNVLERHVVVRNRITWEREKGRGAKSNWKNASEDIWFCTVSDDFYFNVEAVKLKRKVIAPYKVNGSPKDWEETKVKVSQVHFVPIEYLKWSCLTLGALGAGQIQIANSKHVEIDATKTRRSWMLEFCDNVLQFYPREIVKINKRIGKFEKVKNFWLAKKED